MQNRELLTLFLLYLNFQVDDVTSANASSTNCKVN